MSRNRKRKTNFFTVIGLLLIVAALALSVYNINDERSAEQASEEIMDVIVTVSPTDTMAADSDLPYYMLNPLIEMPTTEIQGRDYIGVLTIPVLDIELPVQSKWSYAGLKIAPGRYSGSVYQDNMSICAHNYSRHFGRIKNLELGDQVIFTDVDGNEFRYVVANKEVLAPTATAQVKESEYDMTLFTCTLGGRTRVVVRLNRQS